MNTAIQKNFNYFLDMSFKPYKEGEWIAIFENKVISHGMELKDVVNSAKEIAPLAKVLISKIKKTASYL
jgi:ribosomal protein S3AE